MIITCFFIILGIAGANSFSDFLEGLLGYTIISCVSFLSIFIYNKYKSKRNRARNQLIYEYSRRMQERQNSDKLVGIQKFKELFSVVIQIKEDEDQLRNDLMYVKNILDSINPFTTIAFEVMFYEKHQSSIFLQRELDISEQEASDILLICDTLGLSFTSPEYDNFKDEDEFYKLIDINDLLDLEFFRNNNPQVLAEDNYSIEKVDLLDGREFEHFISQLLTTLGYKTRVTQASNDYGADVIAEKYNIKYVIQCKLYSSPVSNSAVQEVNASKSYYNAHVAIVVTNNTFTRNAIKLAEENNVLLWDRMTLIELMNKSTM